MRPLWWGPQGGKEGQQERRVSEGWGGGARKDGALRSAGGARIFGRGVREKCRSGTALADGTIMHRWPMLKSIHGVGSDATGGSTVLNVKLVR